MAGMTSTLKGSEHFIWDVRKPLGAGATSIVCLGRNKRTGKQVAVKSFTVQGNHRSEEVKIREFEVLQKVEHENIVTLLAIEEELNAYKSKVIVMELCMGGSVHSMLEEPAHQFGLKEDDFLLFMKHVAAGMKHLRDNNIIHRDIKPGNILRCITEDGSSVYKLTDFGAARELSDGETFTSIYGTEEFLHPAMFEKGVLRENRGNLFNESVDLWSLGVTLYHVATGTLPFKPFGGKENRATMYRMTTAKESGVISGLQTTQNGRIIWSKLLPKSCALSQQLQTELTKLLAGLLETDPKKSLHFDQFFTEVERIVNRRLVHVFSPNVFRMLRIYVEPTARYFRLLETDSKMSLHFDQFFSEVERIVNRRVVHVFSPNVFRLLRIYVDPTASLPDLQKAISQHTNISPPNQLLFYNHHPLSSTVNSSQHISTYPLDISSGCPIVVLNTAVQDIPVFPDVVLKNYPQFGSTLSLDTDPSLAKTCLAIMTCIQREATDLILRQRLTIAAVSDYRLQIQEKIERLQQSVKTAAVYTTLEHKRVSATCGPQKQLFELSKQQTTKSFIDESAEIEHIENLDKEVSEKMEELERSVERLMMNQSENSVESILEWRTGQTCTDKSRCMPYYDGLINEVKAIGALFKQDRQKRAPQLTYNEEQIHKFEKNNLYMFAVKAKTTLNDHCVANSKLLYTQFHKWTTFKMDADCNGVDRILSQNGDYKEDHSQFHKWTTLACTVEDDITNIERKLQDFTDLRTKLSHSIDQISTINLADIIKENIPKETKCPCDCQVAPNVASQQNATSQAPKVQANHLADARNRVTYITNKSDELLNNAQNNNLIINRLLSRNDSRHSIQSPTLQSVISSPLPYTDQNMKNGYISDEQQLSNLANDDITNFRSANGWTALHHMAFSGTNVDRINQLIRDCQLDVNAVENNLATPLHLCCINNTVEFVDVLLRNHADVNALDFCGRTPLIYACLSNNCDAVTRLLRENPDVTTQDIYGNTCLHYAVLKNSTVMIESLVKQNENLCLIGNNNNETCLHFACEFGNLKTVEFLLKSTKINVNARDISGNTAFHKSAKSGNSLIVALFSTSTNIDVNIQTYNGVTSLMYAAKHGHINALSILLQNRRVNVNITDSTGYTVLMHAIASGHFDIVKILLLQKSVLLTLYTTDGQTALHIAAVNHRNDILTLLLQNNQSKSIVNAPDITGRTVLHEISTYCDVDMVKFVLHVGADHTIVDKLGQTSAMLAHNTGNTKVAQFLDSLQ